ncbi:MAG: glutamate-cysteine ligase family protein [Raoultibacter sp.]
MPTGFKAVGVLYTNQLPWKATETVSGVHYMNTTATSSEFSSTPNVSAHNRTHQPAREHNINAIVAFYESGAKDTVGEIGIELEHIIVKADGLQPVSYSENHGIEWVLEQLLPEYPKPTYDSEGDLLGLFRQGEAITLEPAAQLELSAGPFRDLATAEAAFLSFESTLEDILAPAGLEALTLGYHPTARASELELIPKRRYKFMNNYLSEVGPWGPRMMRGSASTQVSIDYATMDDCLRKFRLAYALVPIISLICDNSPIFEGEKRPHELMRTEVWEHCDPDRCGLVPGVMDESFNLRSYAEYILDTPAILVPCKKNEWCYSEKTFGEIYAETPMEKSDVEHALSMFFNDVRLKTYIEIRPADSLPVPYAISYAALVKGLFATGETLAALDALFADVTAEDIDAAKAALMAAGYDAEVYSRPVAEIADRLMMIAKLGLVEDERHYLEPLEQLVFNRVTLADVTDAE